MLNLGLLTDYMHTYFRTSLISYISDATIRYGIRLLCYEFTFINYGTQRIKPLNLLKLITKRKIDGLIIIPGSLEPYVCTEQFYSFLKKHLSIPIIFILSQVKSAPFIRINNEEGMNKLLFHLFAEHGYRHPAFLRGSIQNSDFNLRFEVFKSFCNDYGITIDNKYIYNGDFSYNSGRTGILMLFKEKKPNCDIIIAANDYLAAGAMIELQTTYGLCVPDDIAVVGFDDIQTAGFMNPPLTTVRQPLHDLGFKTVEYFMEIMNGNTVPQKTILPTELIIRDSCGCMRSVIETKDKDFFKQVKNNKVTEIPGNRMEPYVVLYKKQDVINYNDENLDKIMKYLGQHYADSELTVNKVEKATGIPSLKIAKIINEKFNIHFKNLLNKIRCAEAKRLLGKTDQYITDIAFQVGYNSRNHFYKAFIQSTGLSPKNYRSSIK